MIVACFFGQETTEFHPGNHDECECTHHHSNRERFGPGGSGIAPGAASTPAACLRSGATERPESMACFKLLSSARISEVA